MGLLSQLGYSNLQFKEPERLTPDEARRRLVLDTLTRQRKALEDRRAPLSQANKNHLFNLKEFEDKFSSELEARTRKVEAASRLDQNSKRNTEFKKRAISELLQLHQRHSALVQRAAAERRAKSFQEQSADRRFYNPVARVAGQLNPRNIYGGEAKTYVSHTSKRIFKNPLLSIPCVQRMVRAEVMHALGHAKGHKGKRRKRNPWSLIGC